MRIANRLIGVLALSFYISGCSSMNFDKLSSTGPDFNFIDYFEGHTKASGWFSDRFGNVKRHFCGDFFGEIENGVFILDEKLYYSDGIVEERIWNVTIDADGHFIANSDSLVGEAVGLQQGSALKLHYIMNVLVATDKTWALKMNDYMFFQPDGSLHNNTEVNKWGVRIGNVSTQYYKHDGSQACFSDDSASMQRTNTLKAVSSIR